MSVDNARKKYLLDLITIPIQRISRLSPLELKSVFTRKFISLPKHKILP